MDYIRPKLQMNRYKNRAPHILFQKIAQEIQYEMQTKLNFSLDAELSLWLIRLMSLNTKYCIGPNRLFDRVAVDALIKDYLQIVSGNLTFCRMYTFRRFHSHCCHFLITYCFFFSICSFFLCVYALVYDVNVNLTI